MEIPELKLQGIQAKGLQVVGLQPRTGGLRKAYGALCRYKMDYPVGWVSHDVALALMQGRDAIPQSFVISRDGRILKRFIGFSAAGTPQQLRDAIEEALKG